MVQMTRLVLTRRLEQKQLGPMMFAPLMAQKQLERGLVPMEPRVGREEHGP